MTDNKPLVCLFVLFVGALGGDVLGVYQVVQLSLCPAAPWPAARSETRRSGQAAAAPPVFCPSLLVGPGAGNIPQHLELLVVWGCGHLVDLALVVLRDSVFGINIEGDIDQGHVQDLNTRGEGRHIDRQYFLLDGLLLFLGLDGGD